MKPINDQLYIKLIPKPETTKNRLILPTLEGGANEPEYKVLKIGPKCKGVKVGDTLRLYPQVNLIPYDEGYFIREISGIKVIIPRYIAGCDPYQI